jgi:hypothetical protein
LAEDLLRLVRRHRTRHDQQGVLRVRRSPLRVDRIPKKGGERRARELPPE